MLLDGNEVKWKAVRASGPGGQKVNRRSTKVQMWVKISDLPLSDREKKLLRKKLVHHLNHSDELEVWCEEERSQEQNKDRALEHLNEIILEALKVPPLRIKTEPTRSSEEKRIRGKKIVSEKKRARRSNR